jgi:hypothetical protein
MGMLLRGQARLGARLWLGQCSALRRKRRGVAKHDLILTRICFFAEANGAFSKIATWKP